MRDQLEQDLREMLGALADRADGTTSSSAAHVIARAGRRVRRRRIAATATGALVAVAVVCISVVASRTADPTKVIDAPSPSTTEFVPQTTAASSGPVGPTANDGNGPVVDVTDPPPLFTPRPFASIDMASAGTIDSHPSIAVTTEGAVVIDHETKTALTVNEATGAIDRIPLSVDPFEIVVTNGVLFGTVWGNDLPPTLRMVAIALAGPRAGQVVGDAALDPITYTEDPVGRFGLGASGIVDRISSTTVMSYVKAEGMQPGLTLPIPTLAQSASTIISGSGQSWALDVRRHADAATPFEGDAPPAWSSDGDAVTWTSIGPRSDPGSDFGTPTMPVIATLHPDGSIRWMRLPDGWRVASSDTSGVIIIRESAGRIELARFSDLTLNIESHKVTIGDVTLEFGLWPSGYQPTLVRSNTFTGVYAGTVSTAQFTKTGARATYPIVVTVLRGRDEVAAALADHRDALSPLEPTVLEVNGVTVLRNIDPLHGTPTFYTWSPTPDLAITIGVPITFTPGVAETFIVATSASW